MYSVKDVAKRGGSNRIHYTPTVGFYSNQQVNMLNILSRVGDPILKNSDPVEDLSLKPSLKLRTNLVGNSLELLKADLGGLAGLPLFQQLPDTGDHVQPRLEGEADLFSDQLVRLAKDIAALRVAEDDPFAATVQDHAGGQLTCHE